MSKFIEVTDHDLGRKTLINLDTVIVIEDSCCGTAILFDCHEMYFAKESYQEIKDMINKVDT